jgi:O-antigen ligase
VKALGQAATAKASARPTAGSSPTPRSNRWFEAAFGGFLGLTLLKFGNPPIMEKWVTTPTDIYQFVLGFPWPIAWAYGLLALLTIAGLFAARWTVRTPRWLLVMPLAWFAWQLLAGTQTLDGRLTGPTLMHFAACVVCFYLGCFVLGGSKRLTRLWGGLIGGFLLAMAIGWEQHFGGLAATQRYFQVYKFYLFPNGDVPPEYLKKMSSTRIFATFFYPNTLAGGVLLLLPPILGALSQARRLFTAGARGFLMGATALAALACLYWSASKGGWLLMLLVGMLALLRLQAKPGLKVLVVCSVLVAGLAGFWWRHAMFFERGATSVSARFDYWRAALETTRAHPLLGTGPATFSIAYARLKRPESEMTRLTHNDYLEQASDSGIPGFLAYVLFIGGVLLYSAPFSFPQAMGAKAAPQLDKPLPSPAGPSSPVDWLPFSVWLGVLGWALQQVAEFGLYIPALAWPAFAFMGWLCATRKSFAPEKP